MLLIPRFLQDSPTLIVAEPGQRLLANAHSAGYTTLMCGRYTLTNPSDLATRFGLGAITEARLEPRFNIAPAQLVPIVVEGEEGRSLERMRWGFKPAWMKDFRQPPPINARAETLLDRPLFRGAVRRHRCIMPAS